MGWLRKLPIVSLLFAVAMVAAPFVLEQQAGSSGLRFEQAREDARAYLVRNPSLQVDALGELTLDPTWLAEMRDAASKSESSLAIQLPPRMLARSQARLDELVARTYQARMDADPTWRLGVLDAQSPQRNYLAHAFVHPEWAGIVLCVVVLLLAGAPLERTWGSLIFGAVAIASLPVAAHAYRVFDASSGVPWSGSAGLAGALLGAYFIRGLGGHFVFPGWILLPVWLAVETFVVRGFWIDGSGSMPWATLCGAIGFGALASGGLRLLNVESRVDQLTGRHSSRGPHPVVVRAARLRSDGDPYQAFDLIQAAWRDEPGDADVAEAFFSIAVEVGQPEAAAEAILPSLRQALRKGEVKQALDYWLPLATRRCEVRLEPTAAVRLGEALLDAGHPEEAIFSLQGALEVGVSSAHAARIVKIARDLDEELTRRAATIALNDAALDPRIRAELEPIASVSPDGRIGAATDASPTEAGASRSQLDRRVQAEHHPIETTAFPTGSAGEASDPEKAGASAAGAADPNEASLAAQDLDATALSAESLADEVAVSDEDLDLDLDVGDSGDVLSHWNDRDALDETKLIEAEPDELSPEGGEAGLLGDDLGASTSDLDFGLEPVDDDFFGPDDETDSDLTPMMESTDELTSPLDAGAAAEAAGDVSCAVFDQPTTFMEAPRAGASGASEEFEIGSSQPEVAPNLLRGLKALDAVPVEASEEWIEIDAAERGKSKLPLTRIQAIAMAAVSGMASRPVLVVDLVLNWSDDIGQPMKSIRLRSDRFDPLRYVPDAKTPLAALTTWVVRLQALSGATCLPSRDLLGGEYARFDSLEDYEREVLMAVRGAGA